MLVGTTVVLGGRWPVMGRSSARTIVYVAAPALLSTRLHRAGRGPRQRWDTRMGGALGDADRSNAVVKAFGAEEREEARLDRVVGKWRDRTRRTWKRGT